MNELEKFSLVPEDFQKEDPRQIAYLYPQSIMNSEQNFISYNKKLQKFLYNHSLDVAEQAARIFGYILLPSSCMHWRRTKEIQHRRIYVGRRTFYFVKYEELNKNEQKKLMQHIEEIRGEAM